MSSAAKIPAVIFCGQSEHRIKPHVAFTKKFPVVPSSDDGPTEESLLKKNIDLLVKNDYDVFVISDCAQRKWFPFEELEFKSKSKEAPKTYICHNMFQSYYQGGGHCLTKVLNRLQKNALCLYGNILLTDAIIKEIKAKPLNTDIIYPVKEKQDLGLFKLSDTIIMKIHEHFHTYFNGFSYNSTPYFPRTYFEIEHLFKEPNVFRTTYETSHTIEKF